VHLLPKTVISSASNTYAKKSKRLGIGELPLGRLKMVISTYSNILLSVSMINLTNMRVSGRPENGDLDCLKYLHETAKAPWNYLAVRERTRTTTPSVYNTSSTTTVLYHSVGLTKMESYTLLRKRKEITSTGKKSWNTRPGRLGRIHGILGPRDVVDIILFFFACFF